MIKNPLGKNERGQDRPFFAKIYRSLLSNKYLLGWLLITLVFIIIVIFGYWVAPDSLNLVAYLIGLYLLDSLLFFFSYRVSSTIGTMMLGTLLFITLAGLMYYGLLKVSIS